jgi:hypothetical protein
VSGKKRTDKSAAKITSINRQPALPSAEFGRWIEAKVGNTSRLMPHARLMPIVAP